MGPSTTVTILLSALLGWSHVAPSPAPVHGMVHLPLVYNNSVVHSYPWVYSSAAGGFFYSPLGGFYFPTFQSLISQTNKRGNPFRSGPAKSDKVEITEGKEQTYASPGYDGETKYEPYLDQVNTSNSLDSRVNRFH